LTVEAHVLALFGRELRQPDLVAEFIAAYSDGYHQLASDLKAKAANRQRERAVLDRKIANQVDAIGDRRSSPSIMAKLTELEGQRAKIGDEVAAPVPDAPALHPVIAEVCSRNMDELTEALPRGGDPEALESARALIHKILIHPPETECDPPGIELTGELMALLQAAGLNSTAEKGSAASHDPILELFVSPVKEGSGQSPWL
jgi:site-specific DNA recombinase